MSSLVHLLPDGVTVFGAFALLGLSFAGSMLTAGLGIGGGVMVMAGMLIFLPPTVVLPTHGVVQLGSNAGRAALMLRQANWRIAGWFAGGALLGALVGSQALVALPERVLLVVLAVFVLYTTWAPKLKKRMLPERGYFGVGALTTLATLFLGATGPLVAAFWSPEKMGRHALVATHAVCMTMQHVLKVAAFGFVGFVLWPWLPVLGAMVVVGFLGTLAGKKVLDRLPPERFALGFRIVLTLLSVRLLWQALSQ